MPRFRLAHLILMLLVALVLGAGVGLMMKKKDGDPPPSTTDTKGKAKNGTGKTTTKNKTTQPKKITQPATKEQLLELFAEVEGIRTLAYPEGIKASFEGDDVPKFDAELLKSYAPDKKETNLRTTLLPVLKSLSDVNPLAVRINDRDNKAILRMAAGGMRKSALKKEEAFQAELQKLKDVAAERATASKRWQAIYDFACAQLLTHIILHNEYGTLAGMMAKKLPPIDTTKEEGWELAPQAKPVGGKEVLDLIAERKSYLESLAKNNPYTPWEAVAKKELAAELGLRWATVPKSE